MMKKLTDLKNIGPATIRQLKEVGVDDSTTLKKLGAVEVYRRLKHAFPRQVSIVMVYALEGALLDCHWNRLPPERKTALRDALRAG